jgi:transposase
VRQADRDEGKRTDGLTSAEKEELARLRRENRALKEGVLPASVHEVLTRAA